MNIVNITSSTKQDILHCLLKQGRSPAQEIADTLGISPQAVRRHLKDLEEDHLIEYEAIQIGMGRPQLMYRVSTSGREQLRHLQQRQEGSPPNKGFAVELLGAVAATVSPEQMQDILHKAWQQKAREYRQQIGNGPLGDRLAQLVKLRYAEGYMAEFYPVPEATQPNTYLFTEYNCAISSVAQTFPTVCEHELDMFAIALDDCHVERTHWMVDGEHRCGYLITPREDCC